MVAHTGRSSIVIEPLVAAMEDSHWTAEAARKMSACSCRPDLPLSNSHPPNLSHVTRF